MMKWNKVKKSKDKSTSEKGKYNDEVEKVKKSKDKSTSGKEKCND